MKLNKKSLFFLVGVFSWSWAQASLPPGFYEVQDLTGRTIGECTVTLSSTTFEYQPAQRYDLKLTLRGTTYREEEVVITDENGLAYVRTFAGIDGSAKTVEGARVDGLVKLNVTRGVTSYSVPLDPKQASRFDFSIDAEGSPFRDMKKGDVRETAVFVAHRPGVVQARRVVQDEFKVPKDGREINVVATNTQFEDELVSSWYDADRHELIKELRRNRMYFRRDR